MHPAVACSILLALHVPSGAHVVEHASYDDRIAWVLPPDRLAAFAHSGVVIDEDVRTTTVVRTVASDQPRGMTTLHGQVFKVVTDVPRHRTTHAYLDVTAVLTPRNEEVPAHVVDIEDAGMTALPAQPLCVGASWRARLPVVTVLGSGTATIDHTIVAVRGDWVEVDVRGRGVITGVEYNLPRLLPGSIEIRGTAWFDRAAGLVRQESYLIVDRLIRTVSGKTIGFVETETVDESDSETLPRTRP